MGLREVKDFVQGVTASKGRDRSRKYNPCLSGSLSLHSSQQYLIPPSNCYKRLCSHWFIFFGAINNLKNTFDSIVPKIILRNKLNQRDEL